MEVNLQHMNTVSVLGSKEITKGWASEINCSFRSDVYICYLNYLILQSKEERYFINNHLSFRVMYHKDAETDSARIVGFEVSPNRC